MCYRLALDYHKIVIFAGVEFESRIEKTVS